MSAYPNRATVAAGRLNGWECQRVSGIDRVVYLIERSDGKLHEAPRRIHAAIDAAVDGVAPSVTIAETVSPLGAEGKRNDPAGMPGTPAHSKSEYKRRTAPGDPNVLPPDWHAEWGKPWTTLEALQYANMLLAQRGTSDSRIDAVLAAALGVASAPAPSRDATPPRNQRSP